jgi:hypothetical protein
MSKTLQVSTDEEASKETAGDTWPRLQELAEDLVALAEEAESTWICIPDSDHEAAKQVASLLREAGRKSFDLASNLD